MKVYFENVQATSSFEEVVEVVESQVRGFDFFEEKFPGVINCPLWRKGSEEKGWLSMGEVGEITFHTSGGHTYALQMQKEGMKLLYDGPSAGLFDQKYLPDIFRQWEGIPIERVESLYGVCAVENEGGVVYYPHMKKVEVQGISLVLLEDSREYPAEEEIPDWRGQRAIEWLSRQSVALPPCPLIALEAIKQGVRTPWEKFFQGADRGQVERLFDSFDNREIVEYEEGMGSPPPSLVLRAHREILESGEIPDSGIQNFPTVLALVCAKTVGKGYYIPKAGA